MPIDVTVPNSPGWWLQRVAQKLQDPTRRARLQNLHDRYTGNAPLPVSLEQAPEAAKRFWTTSRTNLAEMIVKAPRYRLQVVSIGTGASTDEEGDQEAWRLLRQAEFEEVEPDVHRLAGWSGDGFVIVGSDPDGVVMTSEDPRQVATIHDPRRQSRILAGGKIFHDPNAGEKGRDLAYLYLPGRVWCAYLDRAARQVTDIRFNPQTWEWDEQYGGAAGKGLPISEMPIVRFRNEEGVGEFERHVDILDRIDHLVLQGMTIATLQAFKQRAIKVSPRDMPDEDEDGNEIDYSDTFLADPGSLWKLPESAEIWESGGVDMTPVGTLAKDELQRLSAATFTPMHLFSSDAVNQSATGAELIRDGIHVKVEDRQRRYSPSWARVTRLVMLANEQPENRTDLGRITVMWKPARQYTLTEKYAAAVQAKTAGVPWRTIMSKILQFSPAEIAEAEAQRMQDQMMARLAMAAGAPTQPGAAQPPQNAAAGAQEDENASEQDEQ